MTRRENRTDDLKQHLSTTKADCASFTAYRLRELCNGAEPTDEEIEHLRECEICRKILERSFSLFG